MRIEITHRLYLGDAGRRDARVSGVVRSRSHVTLESVLVVADGDEVNVLPLLDRDVIGEIRSYMVEHWEQLIGEGGPPSDWPRDDGAA